MDIIPGAGACTTTKNVMSGAGRPTWMVREESKHPADNGWVILSDIDTEEYLADTDNFVIAPYNDLCELEPALIAIYDFPVGSDLQIVEHDDGIAILDTITGRLVPPESYYVPPPPRA